jgi:transketolase
MAIKLAAVNQKEGTDLPSVYSQTLIDMMNSNSSVVELEADLGICIWGPRLGEVRQMFPDRFIDCGIQEANMVGVACGLSVAGFIPFAHSFAPFITRRACDPLFISGCYSKLNVRVVGTDPGIMAAFNGGTHMPFEDVAIVRSFPGMTIIEPTDSVMLVDILKQLEKLYGMYYIRLSRENMVKVYEQGSTFEIGKGNVIREGGDVTIITAGILVEQALLAADMLKKRGVSTRVIDMFTIKPIDRALVIKSAKETGAIVTAENHNIIGGLADAVCEVLADEYPIPVERIGVNDEFGEVGPVEYLMERFHLRAEDIEQKALKVIARK